MATNDDTIKELNREARDTLKSISSSLKTAYAKGTTAATKRKILVVVSKKAETWAKKAKRISEEL